MNNSTRRRIQTQKKKLLENEYTISPSQDPFHYTFKKDQKQFDVTFSNDYPFKPPKIIKKTKKKQFVLPTPNWTPALTLEKIFGSHSNQQLIKKILQGQRQHVTFQKLIGASPFISMSLLKPVSTYPDESFDSQIAPFITDNQVIEQFFKTKNVELISFNHGRIIVGIYILAFEVLCSLFGISVIEGHRILLSDINKLSPNHKLFLHMCFADYFKKGFPRQRNKELLQLTNQYIKLLREKKLLEMDGFNYADIHNNSLILLQDI